MYLSNHGLSQVTELIRYHELSPKAPTRELSNPG